MSDIFLSAGISPRVDELTERLRWVSYTRIWNGQVGLLNWLVTRVDDAALWSPARDSRSHTYGLVAGRFAFDEAEWQQAEGLPYAGGLAARLILDRWLNGGARAVEQLNGGGVAVIIDEAKRALHLWTDRLGFYPLFAWTQDGFVICSNTDVAAEALDQAGHSCKFDTLTMAEFLQTGTATQPYTYWSGVDQLDAGIYYHFSFSDRPRLVERRQYWQPAYFDQPYLTDRREIVERLTDALTSAVRKRTLPRLGKVVVMLSAGADSRTALFAACEPSKVTCFTFYDEPNAELNGAQALAAAARARHITFQRDKEYYIEHADQAVRMSGGMWSVDSAHYGGIIDQLHDENPGVVLTGCYADYLLKGLSFNRRHKTFLGRSLPLYQLTDFSYQWYQPFCSIGTNWKARVASRQKERFLPVEAGGDKAQSIAEYLRTSPIVREPDASGRRMLRCVTAFDNFISDNDVLDLVGRISPEQKLNGVPFGMAVSRITGKLGRGILNNNYAAPVSASEIQRVLHFARASLMRKLTGQGSGQPCDHDPNSVATVGSWPHLPRVIKLSERLRDWQSTQLADQKDFLFDLLGTERRNWTLDEWADHDSVLFFRYYTASLWLRQNPEAI